MSRPKKTIFLEPDACSQLDNSLMSRLLNHGEFRGDSDIDRDLPSLEWDTESSIKFHQLLQAAGFQGLIMPDGRNISDPEVIRELSREVGFTVDDLPQSLSREKLEIQEETPLTLVQACQDGNLEMAQHLIKEGVDVNEITAQGDTPLTCAVNSDRLDLVEMLLYYKADVNLLDKKMEGTALMEAASAGFTEMVALLLKYGAKPELQSNTGNTALHYAAINGQRECVDLLLTAAANTSVKVVSPPTEDGDTQQEMVNILELENENGHTVLMEAASNGHVEVAKLLIERGADVNTHSHEFKESALTLASYKGHADMVKYLLDAGADYEHRTDEMHTALMEAAMDGHVEVARILLEYGAQVNMPADSFESPLTLAACGGHTELCSVLLEFNADVEEVNDEGYSPLMEAAREGHASTVALLLAHNANPNVQTEETQETALTLAACGGFVDVGRHLLDYNADIELTAEGGRTPLMKASRAGNIEFVKMLVENGSGVDKATSSQDHTALSLACSGGHYDVVKYLLQQGADPKYRLKDNSTMIIEASRAGHTDVIQLLLDYPNGLDISPPSTPSPYTSSCPAGNATYPSRLYSGQECSNHHPHHHPGAAALHSNHLNCAGVETQCSNSHVNSLHASSQSSCPHGSTNNLFPGSSDWALATMDELLSPGNLNTDIRHEELLRQLRSVKLTGSSPLSCSDDLAALASLLDPQLNSIVTSYTANCQSSAQNPPNVRLPDPTGSNDQQKPPPRRSSSSTVQSGCNSHSDNRSSSTQPSHSHSTNSSGKASASTTPVRRARHHPASLQSCPNVGSVDVTDACPNYQHLSNGGEYCGCVQHCRASPPRCPSPCPATPPPLPSHPRSPGVGEAAVSSNRSMSTSQEEVTFGDNHLVTCANQHSQTQPCDLCPELFDCSTKKHLHLFHRQQQLQNSTACQCEYDTENSSPASPLPNDLSQLEGLCQAACCIQNSRHQRFQNNSPLKQVPVLPPHQPPPPTLPPPPPPSSSSSSSSSGNTYQETKLSGRQPKGKSVDGGPPNYLVTNQNENKKKSLNKQNPVENNYWNSMINKAMHSHSTGPCKSNHCPPASFPVGYPAPASGNSSSHQMDVNAYRESSLESALTLACAGGHVDLVSLLLSRGADLEHCDKKGSTPLHTATLQAQLGVIKVLLDHGADIDAQIERTKDTALSIACSNGKYEIVAELLKRGANREHRNVSDYTPLSLAASGGFVDVIELLLQNHAEINSRTGSKLGISPLMLAAMNGHVEAVRLLLDNGSDINAQIETNKNTALTLACFQGRDEVVRLLVEKKANIEHRAKTGLTPLMEAASGGFVEVGRILISSGADVNAPPVPSSRDTALTIAADKGHAKFVKLLLDSKAHVDVKNKKGATPLWLACAGGHFDVVVRLVQHDADVNSLDNRKVSCLMVAFRGGHIKIVKFLVCYVTQFPSDNDCIRYIQTLSDKELAKRCSQCMDLIVAAKDAQEAEANKNARILLAQLSQERDAEHRRLAQQAKRREKKKERRRAKQEAMNHLPNDVTEKNETFEDFKVNADESKDNTKKPEDSPSDTPDRSSREETPSYTEEKSCQSSAMLSNHNAENDNSESNHDKEVKSSNRKKKKKRGQKEKPGDHVNPSNSTTSKPTDSSNNYKSAKKQSCSSLSSTPNQTIQPSTSSEPPVTSSSAPSTTTDTRSTSSTNSSTSSTKENKKSSMLNGTVDHYHSSKYENYSSSTAEEKNDEGYTDYLMPSDGFDHAAWANLVETKSVAQPLVQHLAMNIASTGASSDSKWTMVTKKSATLSVPSRDIGRVIGQSGSTVNSIREQTGAHIDIEGQKPGSHEDRVIHIKGSQEAVAKARQIIEALVNNKSLGRDILLKGSPRRHTNNSNIQPLLTSIVSLPTSTSVTTQQQRKAIKPLPIVKTSSIAAPTTAVNSSNSSIINYAKVAAAGLAAKNSLIQKSNSQIAHHGKPTPLLESSNFPTISESIRIRQPSVQPLTSQSPQLANDGLTASNSENVRITSMSINKEEFATTPVDAALTINTSCASNMHTGTPLVNADNSPSTTANQQTSAAPHIVTDSLSPLGESGSSTKSFPRAPGSERSQHQQNQRTCSTPLQSPQLDPLSSSVSQESSSPLAISSISTSIISHPIESNWNKGQPLTTELSTTNEILSNSLDTLQQHAVSSNSTAHYSYNESNIQPDEKQLTDWPSNNEPNQYGSSTLIQNSSNHQNFQNLSMMSKQMQHMQSHMVSQVNFSDNTTSNCIPNMDLLDLPRVSELNPSANSFQPPQPPARNSPTLHYQDAHHQMLYKKATALVYQSQQQTPALPSQQSQQKLNSASNPPNSSLNMNSMNAGMSPIANRVPVSSSNGFQNSTAFNSSQPQSNNPLFFQQLAQQAAGLPNRTDSGFQFNLPLSNVANSDVLNLLQTFAANSNNPAVFNNPHAGLNVPAPIGAERRRGAGPLPSVSGFNNSQAPNLMPVSTPQQMATIGQTAPHHSNYPQPPIAMQNPHMQNQPNQLPPAPASLNSNWTDFWPNPPNNQQLSNAFAMFQQQKLQQQQQPQQQTFVPQPNVHPPAIPLPNQSAGSLPSYQLNPASQNQHMWNPARQWTQNNGPSIGMHDWVYD